MTVHHWVFKSSSPAISSLHTVYTGGTEVRDVAHQLQRVNFLLWGFLFFPFFSPTPQLALAFKLLFLIYFSLFPSYFLYCSAIAFVHVRTDTAAVTGEWGAPAACTALAQIWRFKHCHPLCCMVGMAVGAVPLLTQPGSMTVSFLSYFLSLKSIWFPFCALQCQLINHSASSLMLDKTISLSLPAFHKASMYRIKFVVLFPDKNELR